MNKKAFCSIIATYKKALKIEERHSEFWGTTELS
jgi:hypothetical protein